MLEKAVYTSMDGNLQRRYNMKRLHLFADDNVPKEMMENISNQIRRIRTVPKRLDHYDPEFVEKFPKIVDYPTDYILR